MAEVFEAELVGELGFVRKVAIKRMVPEAAAEPTGARRFLDEARIASRLHHANIVSVIDVGLLDGLPFHVLELVDGVDAQTLQQRAGGTLPLEVALVLAGEVAHALDHAHGAVDDAGVTLGIVHRDVKPSNVLVSWGGDVKLGDFGIAVARDRTARTEAGIVGTMGFMAPEQRTRSQIDGRTDVYALGLTLHALVTGASPLQDFEVELRVLAGGPMPIDPTLPSDVRALIVSAVAPELRARPTAGQLGDAISKALAARLANDPRSFLRGFLRQYGTTGPRPGALDGLLGIEVVLDAAPSGDDAVRSYRTIAAKVAAIDKPTGAATVKLEPTEVVPVARSRRLGWLALVLLAGLGAFVVWHLSRSDRASAVAIDGAIAKLDPDASAVPEAAVPIDAVMDVPLDAHPIDGPKRVPVPVLADAAVAPSPPAETGYLQVVGEELIGAKVIVDGGVYTTYVPRPVAVPAGHHRVQVQRRDGTLLDVKSIDVNASNTHAHPAQLSW
jgi:hypothetical protein